MQQRFERAICVMSAEGTDWANKLTIGTASNLEKLKKEGYGIVISHIGERDSYVSEALIGASAYIVFRRPLKTKNPKIISALIADCYKEAVWQARTYFQAQAILTTEGDKPDFVKHIPAVLAPIIEDGMDVVLAERSREGFAQFPLVQRVLESRVDRKISSIVGYKGDFTYGPRAFSSEAAELFDQYKERDWGILTYPVVCSALQRKGIDSIEVPGFPQERYMDKYPSLMRLPPVQLLWRLVQNIPHVRAAKMAEKELREFYDCKYG